MEILIIIQVAFFCLLVLLAIIHILQLIYIEWRKPDTESPRQPSGKVSQSYRNDPKNRALQGDLLVLLKGDVATAKRLLLQQRRRNPGQADNWYLEKVIYDLERDRH
ncbi:hypothetical protein [Nostoc sp. 'Peltigera membranacea cyanobiont' 210A]|uniref:hypothetical protein n=1 Tax=Nostoc sp. 'Peltigera membranacea cyanobiont' 210A TaxID=2014529 RepID=UPI00167DF373|nr:hypothetical protein [Nostoc sp. 'Peltigera membranacea cyanobiont' 210A]